MERKDFVFITIILLGIAALIALTHRPRIGDAFASVTVPDDTEIVGMSLSPERDPPDASAFHGRFIMLPPPLMGMNPSLTTDALEGVATAQKDYR